MFFDLLNQLIGLLGVEGNASSMLASSGCSSRPVDIGFDILGWLDLNDQFHVFNVESTSSNVSSDKNLEFSFLESLHSNFSLVLRNVSMHDLDVLFDFI